MTGREPSVTPRLSWGYCPVCLHERQVLDGLMTSHQQWVSGFKCGIKNCTECHPYGYMKPCQGSGKEPLEITVRVDRQKMNKAYFESRSKIQYNPGE